MSSNLVTLIVSIGDVYVWLWSVVQPEIAKYRPNTIVQNYAKEYTNQFKHI